jgi:polysaccharide biosynthesis/export protein
VILYISGGIAVRPKGWLVAIPILLCLAVVGRAEDSVYRLAAGDQIRISVWSQDDLLVEVALDPDGRVALPLLGEVAAAGLTLPELTEVITSGYAEFIRSPQVTVVLVARRQISVRVIGEVNKPGTYLVRPEASIAEAIAVAGGPTKRAALEKVQLFPSGSPGEIQVIPQGKANLLGQQSAERSPALADGDVILVPETTKIDWQELLMILGGILTVKQILS